MLESRLQDMEFYLLKINRLEKDLAMTQDELTSVRLRLRTAEDYQIKYELLLKQTQQESSRIRLIEREGEYKMAELMARKVEERDLYWADRLTAQERDLGEKHARELARLEDELSTVRRRQEKAGSKVEDQDILTYKNRKLQKDVEALEDQITLMKRDHEKNREQELRQVKEVLNNRHKQKQDNERKIYREKIDNLEKIIEELQRNLLEAKSKADPNREKQIDRLRTELLSQVAKSNQEIEKLGRAFNQKNEQIEGLLRDKFKAEEELIHEKKQLREYIKTLEDKLFEKEKEHEVELIHLKGRMSQIRQEEAEGFKQQIHQIEASFSEERNSWEVIIKDKDSEIERIKNKAQNDTNIHKEDRARQLRKIEELKNRLKQYEGDRETGETQILLNSLKDIEAKEVDFNNYQNGITFLDRQLKKTITKVEQKNIEITKLVKQLNELRRQSEEEINGLKQKSRRDKKYYSDKILQLEEQLKQLNELLRAREREFKKREKELEASIHQLTKQNDSFKDLVDEMQKDYARAVQNKKAVESSYREERERGLTSKSDLTMIKKQKWLEMERQKSELQAIFKEREEQLKNKHEVEMERLRHERDQLKGENELLKGVVESSKKAQDEGNKQNKQSILAEYNKKMATLNLQIALTQNIYDSIVTAKSRRVKASRVSEFDKIEQDASERESNEPEPEANRESRGPKYFTAPDFGGLGMSFSPNQI